MQRHSGVVRAPDGTALSGASVTVRNYPAGTAATIYSDNSSTPLSNPMTTDSDGRFSFFAADGRYSLYVTAAGYYDELYQDEVLLEDPASIPNDFYGKVGATDEKWWAARFLQADGIWAGAFCGAANWDGVTTGLGGEYDIGCVKSDGTYKLWASYQGWEHSDHSGTAVIGLKSAADAVIRTALALYSGADGTGANYVRITSANAAGNPKIEAAGTGTDIALDIRGKGVMPAAQMQAGSNALTLDLVGRAADDISILRFINNARNAEVARMQGQSNGIVFGTGSAGTPQVVFYHVGAATTYVTLQGSTTGAPIISADGATDVDLVVNGKGNGFVKTARALAVGTSVAPAAGGGTGGGIFLSNVANFGIFFGTGAPTFTAAQSSLYLRRDGGASTRLYSNTNGTNTWSAITSA